jgi:hypothetical protein
MLDSTSDDLVINSHIDDTNTLSQSESTACEGNESRVSDESRSSTLSSGAESMDADSVFQIPSPDPKRQRSSKKKKPPESIRRHLDNQHFSSESNSDGNVSNETNAQDTQMNNPTKTCTDPESRYKIKTCPGRGSRK